MERPSVEHLRLIFETVSDQIVLLEVEGPGQLRIASMNPSTIDVLRPMGYFVGRPLEALAARETEYFQACARAVAEMQPVHYVQRAQIQGRSITVDVRALPVVRDGRCTHVMTLGRDITHEQEMWRALQTSERGLDATLQSIVDAVIVVDPDHHIVRLNRAATQLLHVSAEDCRGRQLDDVLKLADPESGAPLRCADVTAGHLAREVRVHGHPEQFYTLTAAPLRTEGDEPGGAVLTLHDITAERHAAAERRRVEEQLRLSEARYRVQFEHAPEGIMTFDVDAGQFVECNEVALRMFDCEREALFSRNPADLSPPVQPDGRSSLVAAMEHMARTLAGENPVFEWVHRTVRGVDFPCEVRLVRLPGASNLCRASVVDISARRQAEELRLLSSSLMEQNRLIQAANRMKSAFVANMSHEFRTPLNAILGFAELLHDEKVGSLRAEQRECLESVLTSGRHLLGLINGMLDLAKVESGRMELFPQRVDLAAVVAETTDVVRSLAVRKDIALAVESRADLGQAFIDPARLKQVLFNLLSNAIKFTPEGGRVTVRASVTPDDRILIDVEDTGIGIRESDLPRLFVEFSQLDAGLDKHFEGTGLGLALTQRLLQAMGGEVSVRSTWGEGSTFTACLPRKSPSTHASGAPGHAAPEQPSGSGHG